MSIKFKDVAHHYIGCTTIQTEKNFAGSKFLGKEEVLTMENFKYHTECNCTKPILRQFKDITKEELIECFEIDKRYPNHKQETIKHLHIERSNDEVVLKLENQHKYQFGMGIKKKTLEPILFNYLAKQGIDLFDLINNGEAIELCPQSNS
jgi:hypothetical protein